MVSCFVLIRFALVRFDSMFSAQTVNKVHKPQPLFTFVHRVRKTLNLCALCTLCTFLAPPPRPHLKILKKNHIIYFSGGGGLQRLVGGCVAKGVCPCAPGGHRAGCGGKCVRHMTQNTSKQKFGTIKMHFETKKGHKNTPRKIEHGPVMF